MGAAKAVRSATKPRSAKRRAAKRATRKMLTGSYRKVWNGTSTYTKGGLMRKDLMLNKRGKVVSKKQFAKGQKLQKKGGWMTAVMQAQRAGHHWILHGEPRSPGSCP